MGAYCDDGILSEQLTRRISDEIITPTFEGLRAEGIIYRGVPVLRIDDHPGRAKGARIQARFGDPETQALFYRFRGDLAETLLAVSKGTLAATRFDWEPGASVCVVACSGGYSGGLRGRRGDHGSRRPRSRSAPQCSRRNRRPRWRLCTAGGRVLGVTARGRTLDAAVRNA